MRKYFLILLGLILLQCTTDNGLLIEKKVYQNLSDTFYDPPQSSKPWVLWMWMNGNITKVGLEADLNAMHKIGIGGVVIYSIGSHAIAPFVYKPGPVKFMSEEFQDLFKYTVEYAKKLDIKVAMSVCDGFTSAGGPAITPELGMQQLTWTETMVEGSKIFASKLEQPDTLLNYYKDIAVLAFPTLRGDDQKMTDYCSKIYTNAISEDLDNMFDHDLNTYSILEKTDKDAIYIQFDFAEPFPCRAVNIAMPPNNVMQPNTVYRATKATLQVSDDGMNYNTIANWDFFWRRRHDPTHETLQQTNTVTVGMDEVQSRHFRVVLDTKSKVMLGELELLSSDRVHFWEAKAGFADKFGHDGGAEYFDIDRLLLNNSQSGISKINSEEINGENARIDMGNIIELTDLLQEDGTIVWDVPPGKWTIMRIGYTPTGQEIMPATIEGKGLECSKLDPRGIEKQFQQVIIPLLKKTEQIQDSPFKYAHIDSWEAACTNWSENFRKEFIKQKGYDPLNYLPVLTGGRIVNNLKESERFLWDFRQTLSGMIGDNYYGRFRELCHEQGIELHAQPSGAQQFLCNPIDFHSRADISMGEFWYNNPQPRIDCKYAASVGHIFGNELIAGEAFTCGNSSIAWQEDPYSLKQLGDEAFCMGVNHFEIHRYAHQPWIDKKPGMTFNAWGIWFERTNTWWNQAEAWIKYISRCQYMLRQGDFVADICCLTAEGAPAKVGYRYEYNPAIPSGYDYDACHAKVVEDMMEVKDGRIFVNDNMSYKILLLPDRITMSLTLLKKIRNMVANGAIVIGPKPCETPGLLDLPNDDKVLKEIANKVWGECDGVKIKEHRYGKGKVIWGKSFDEVFKSLGIYPDFEYDHSHDEKISYIHRKEKANDYYFVSNQSPNEIDTKGYFRVSSKTPELWNPVTGNIRNIKEYKFTEDDRVILPLRLAPFESAFIVFREASLQHSQYKNKEMKEDFMLDDFEIKGPWNLEFPIAESKIISLHMNELMSWTRFENPEIKYFSGTVTYKQDFILPENYINKTADLILELGTLKNIAEVSLNGKNVATLWTFPFSCKISNYVNKGKNELEIKITNLWPNRLIGDMRLPEESRHTYTNWHPYHADSPLLPSGLFGPVKITLLSSE